MKSSLYKVARRAVKLTSFCPSSTFTLLLGSVLKMLSKTMLRGNAIILSSAEKNFPHEHHKHPV